MSANRSTDDWELDDLRWREIHLDDIRIDEEIKRQGERRKRSDESDGFFLFWRKRNENRIRFL